MTVAKVIITFNFKFSILNFLTLNFQLSILNYLKASSVAVGLPFVSNAPLLYPFQLP